MTHSIGTPLLWFVFTVLVLGMLALDLGVFQRKAHAVRTREALAWTLIWIALALLFNLGLAWRFGSRHGLEFLTGYLIEKALSVDNIFVFLVIFSYFHVPDRQQPRILLWGILGALIMRAVFIFIGAALLERFHWMILVFGGFLVWTGFKILRNEETQVDPERNLVLRVFRKLVPVAHEQYGDRFLLRRDGRWFATPLLVVLVVVEATDLVFAVDSIPAIFAVTTDPFIVYTSNIFAILGLRALFFLLAGVMGRFVYLKVGLGLVLVFVGIKMLISHHYKIPIAVSLGVVCVLLLGAVVASLFKKPVPPEDLPFHGPDPERQPAPGA